MYTSKIIEICERAHLISIYIRIEESHTDTANTFIHCGIVPITLFRTYPNLEPVQRATFILKLSGEPPSRVCEGTIRITYAGFDLPLAIAIGQGDPEPTIFIPKLYLN